MMYKQAVYSSSDAVNEPLLIELSQEARKPPKIPSGIGGEPRVPEALSRNSQPFLPRVSELTVVRHFTRLSQMNFGVDTGSYPLGSCTMKYNPKVNDFAATLPGFTHIHPGQAEGTVQGALHVIWELQDYLKEITGMEAITVQPAAGAHGEYTGMLIAKSYFRDRGELATRRRVLIPDTAHGSNPASAAMAGFEVLAVPSRDGEVDLDALEHIADNTVAAFMVTVPNTLGIFESRILEVSQIIHRAGGLMYFDGANMNALMGVAKPGDFGFDIAHLNLHKAFSTPHGGGGPGSGPVAVRSFLEEYLPVPRLRRSDSGTYYWDYSGERSIGRVREGYGNFGVLLRAYAYIKALGGEGLRQVARDAVLSSNYAAKKLGVEYPVPFGAGKPRKHEFVASAKGSGKRAFDVAKHILSRGHAPTIYFPQIVDEALMIEFTEAETKAEIDAYVDGLLEALNKDLSSEPTNTSVSRLDEAGAARRPILNWRELLG
jgi:glycine dehydrogenase subunit 2